MSSKKAPQPEKSYAVGDIVLAKVKGYPAWPAHVVDNEDAPIGVKREKPIKGKTMYLVQFFPTGDYAWQVPKDLSALSPKEIETYVSNGGKKNGDLLAGYKVARDPQAWIDDRSAALRAFNDLQAAAEQEIEDDQLASDSNGSKRKRDDKEDKKKKKAKVDKANKTKAGVSSAHKVEDSSADKKSKPTSADGGENEDPGLKQTKEWRHKLQKVFLGKAPPDDADVKKCTEYFDAMERYEMQKEWLTVSKLGKVLKRIALLADDYIPNESRYQFRQRSSALTAQWAQLSDNEDGTAADEVKPNGSHAAEASPAPPGEEA